MSQKDGAMVGGSGLFGGMSMDDMVKGISHMIQRDAFMEMTEIVDTMLTVTGEGLSKMFGVKTFSLVCNDGLKWTATADDVASVESESSMDALNDMLGKLKAKFPNVVPMN